MMSVQWIILNSFWKAVLICIGFMLILWLVLSLFVRRQGDAVVWSTGTNTASRKAILIYNPDPFYNFDEQVCKTFATTLSNDNWYAEVLTVKAAETRDLTEADLFVFCANTYNWAPDAAITNLLNTLKLSGQNCAAITLGAGTTDRAQGILEDKIEAAGGNLIDSRAYWLWKRNADPHVVSPNVHIAKLMVEEYATETIKKLK